jgi:hypothetical protein
LTFDIYANYAPSLNSSYSLPSSTPADTLTHTQTPSSLRYPNASLSSKYWHNRYTAWQSREVGQSKGPVRIEDEQIKLFGGEPGDDVGLCYKMLEVFEGMNWIDSLD